MSGVCVFECRIRNFRNRTLFELCNQNCSDISKTLSFITIGDEKQIKLSRKNTSALLEMRQLEVQQPVPNQKTEIFSPCSRPKCRRSGS